MGWRNSKSIELSNSDDLTLRAQIGWPVSRECNTEKRVRDPKCGRDCKYKEVLLWFTENIGLLRWMNRLQYRLSIEMFIVDLQQNISSVNMIKGGDQFDW